MSTPKMISLMNAIKTLDNRRVISRERNKIHARKTRQRKKAHMQCLEKTVNELKEDQVSLKLQIKEKNTAQILIGMFSRKPDLDNLSANTDPDVEELLKRKTEDIPDVSSLPDLPALILPGNHSKKRNLGGQLPVTENAMQEYPNDGINYELLGKDRSACTSIELDEIRKERNRMHAKRTRDRKRLFTEGMSKIIKSLEDENKLLQNHLAQISSGSHGSNTDSASSGQTTPSLNSPAQRASTPIKNPSTNMLGDNTTPEASNAQSQVVRVASIRPADRLNSPETVSHENSTQVTASPTPRQHQGSVSSSASDASRPSKRQCLDSYKLPECITTTATLGTVSENHC
mmetsp:Transcript_373/g.530  ORF Transcript_373/g.530 Transcript_373/m.530 type:complete len:345 (-) Transcript_373:1494-2528(-)